MLRASVSVTMADTNEERQNASDDDSSVAESGKKLRLTNSLGPRSVVRRRTEFTARERKQMVEFIVSSGRIGDIYGRNLWTCMEEAIPTHTWQSLKEHFLKKVLPMIHNYALSQEEVHQFRSLATGKVRGQTPLFYTAKAEFRSKTDNGGPSKIKSNKETPPVPSTSMEPQESCPKTDNGERMIIESNEENSVVPSTLLEPAESCPKTDRGEPIIDECNEETPVVPSTSLALTETCESENTWPSNFSPEKLDFVSVCEESDTDESGMFETYCCSSPSVDARVQVTTRDVAVQTDDVIILPIDWKDRLEYYLDHPDSPYSSDVSDGCPSPIPADDPNRSLF